MFINLALTFYLQACYKFLLARVVLSFGGKVRLLLYVSAGWRKGRLLPEKYPSLPLRF